MFAAHTRDVITRSVCSMIVKEAQSTFILTNRLDYSMCTSLPTPKRVNVALSVSALNVHVYSSFLYTNARPAVNNADQHVVPRDYLHVAVHISGRVRYLFSDWVTRLMKR